jgi:hypothetical protein
MTPLGGYVIAIVVGLLVRGPRRAMAVSVAPWLAVMAAQTWNLASGRGHNPSSVLVPAYWLVQLVILGLTLGVVAGLSDWRSRHPLGRPLPKLGAAQAASLSLVLTIASGLTAILLLVLFPVPASQRGTGNGNPPWEGLVGLAICALSVVVLGVSYLRARRRSAKQQAVESLSEGAQIPAR